MKFKILVSLAILSIFSLTSCTKNSNDNSLIRFAKNIVSTRAQNTTHFIAILKLKNPALMETAQKQNGRAVIDEKLLKVIVQEQAEALNELKKMSSEVQVVFAYRMVLNAIAILAPIELADKIKNIGVVAYTENVGIFERPKTFSSGKSVTSPFSERNSSKFIGAEKLNEAGIKGQGMKVGIIDTGIDYTHAMLGGEGTEEAFKAINPSEPNTNFPNKKVVGGIDLVGTEFDAASAEFKNHIPKPDVNPIDEAGHGTHVAGTVAGHGDGVSTYNGMAPEADLYAIKVFGANGSTSDCVVIAALEYSADPNNDGNNSDQLDVVNLSLGSSYGNPHILYSEAIKNLVNGGTVVVASAGNSGPEDYIVGAPGTSDQALSVAASVDNGDHLWRFNASRINLGVESFLVEAIEAATTKKISEINGVSGKLVFIGMAAEDLSDEQKAAVRGNVALIDRGQVSFNDKIKRASEAGAIGVVVANNSPGSAFPMGTTDKFEIPAIMIDLDVAKKVKAVMKQGMVTIDFKTDEKIEKPELVDTLTDFSSKGPRSVDGHLKPEISAPGENIISAEMGTGRKGVQMSGTSMAAPHIAGVMALLKQAQKNLSAEELKSLVMGTSKTIGKNGDRYPVSQQGAGRVQADKAAESKLMVTESSLSLGEVAVETKKVIRRYLEIKNISNEKLEFSLIFEGNGFITMSSVSNVSIEAKEKVKVAVNLSLDATSMNDEIIHEMDGWIKMMQGESELYRVPVLAVAHKLSALEAGNLVVKSTSEADSSGALAEVTLTAKNTNKGDVLLFNMIGGQDERKPKAADFMTSDCDLQSAGYRIVTQKNSKNQDEDFLQVAVKLYKPMTTWYTCDISLLIDADQDGTPEQELLGASLNSIPGQSSSEFATTLIDAAKARAIRKAYEKAIEDSQDDEDMLQALKRGENYNEALLDQSGMKVYNNSSVAVLQISTRKLALSVDGALAFKLLVTNNEQSTVEFDDYLKSTVKADMRISLKKSDQSFLDLPEIVKFGKAQNQIVEMTKGDGKESLLVLFPNNKFSMSDLHEDSQSQVLKPLYKAD